MSILIRQVANESRISVKRDCYEDLLCSKERGSEVYYGPPFLTPVSFYIGISRQEMKALMKNKTCQARSASC